MSNKIKRIIAFSSYLVWLSTPAPILAAKGSEPPTICLVETIFSNILVFAISFAGLAAFIMFLYGGFKWLTAGTNEKQVQQARGTYTLAILGLTLTIGAWFILRFVSDFTGIDVTIFTIPGC